MVEHINKIIDISMDIHEQMQVYKNRDAKKPKFSNASNFKTGTVHETVLSMNLHTGTHVDAPLHMIENGQTLEMYTLDKFIGKARVLDLSSIEARVVTKKDLEDKEIQSGEILILKTANSSVDIFELDFVYLDAEGAKYLADKGIKAVGIDGLGIERAQPDHETHLALLDKGIPIIEGLRLAHVQAGIYDFIGLPVKIRNVEASPLRAVLIQP